VNREGSGSVFFRNFISYFFRNPPAELVEARNPPAELIEARNQQHALERTTQQ
jgi:hypothetical protein